MAVNDLKNSEVQNSAITNSASAEKEVKSAVTTVSTTNEKKEEEVKLSLTHLNKDFVYELMSVPTSSSNEYRLVTFIILWARRNNIHYEFDNYGNIYLTKGEIGEGEFYPCVLLTWILFKQSKKLLHKLDNLYK